MEIMKLTKRVVLNSDYVVNKLSKALNFPKTFLPLHEPTFVIEIIFKFMFKRRLCFISGKIC